MAMTYKEAMEEFKKGFDKESWKEHERKKAKLKSFARLDFAKGVLCPTEELEGETAYFVKSYKFIGLSHIHRNAEVFRNLRMLNEFLIPILAKQIGLEGATYLAVKKGDEPNYQQIEDVAKVVQMPNSLVSRNFLKENEELFDRDFYHYDCRSGYSLKNFLDDLSYMSRTDKTCKFSFDKEEIKFKFFKLIILDLLTLQLDRHEGNLPLILDKEKGCVKFGYVFDNEYAFNVKVFDCYDLEKDRFGILDDSGKIDVEKVIEMYDKRVAKTSDYMWTISPNCRKDYHSCLKNIASQAKMSKTARRILIEVIKNIDVESAFEDLKETGVQFSPAYKQFTKQIVDYGKKQFVKELTSSKQSSPASQVEKPRNH